MIKILLVEDNPGDVRILEELFKDVHNFPVEIRNTVRLGDAFEYLRQERFDIILLDLTLPDSKGLETLTSMLEYAPDLPIILLTGMHDESLGIEALKQGAQDYLLKGEVDSNLIVRSIRYAIERKHLLVEMEKAREFEQHLAYHDVLTNLPNRLLFFDRLKQALTYTKRYSGFLGVLFLDLDGFKSINDTMGHVTGDRLLQLVAQRLKRCTRESDTIARLGGDEFTILLKGVKTTEDVTTVAQKIQKSITKPFAINNRDFYVTSSVGVSIYPFDGDDAETLLQKADFAMYKAKSSGKNNYHLFNDSNDSSAAKRLTMETELRNAIENDDLVVHYQPQVNLLTGRMIGGEALIRWQHPTKGLIMPMDFIPLAEESGLIVSLGEWILGKACHHNKIWQDAGCEIFPVSINLSARQFREIRLPDTISSMLEKTALPPHSLMLEITESNAMQDVDFTIETLQKLKNLGVKIALDDFGAGYSSLNYLRRFPVDLLKIDKSFVDEVPAEQDDASIIAAIVALARTLGLQVIAEGVEEKEQIDFLRSIQCNYIQGYFYSRPIEEKKFRRILLSGEKFPLAETEPVTMNVV